MEKYEKAEMEVVNFESEDIITTSISVDPDDLPFIGVEQNKVLINFEVIAIAVTFVLYRDYLQMFLQILY